ncbi:RNA polymerase sigma factor [Cytobacillus oceanisediminis]
MPIPPPDAPASDGALTPELPDHDRAAAFALHVEPEIEVLLRVAQSLTGSWAEAEDLVQETMIRAYKGIDAFDGAHPRAWLLTIMRRANINAHRRRRPATADPHAGLEQQMPAFGAPVAEDPQDVVTDTVLSEDLERALDTLDPRFRSVVLLVDVDDLTYAETAEALGIPVGTVMSRLSRARARLRAQLGPHSATRRHP